MNKLLESGKRPYEYLSEGMQIAGMASNKVNNDVMSY